ncbi:hypothetical protein H3146_01780 [Streptomyces sp. OF3]|uniref:DUF4258 domain-containing protein n=1 Tax=Streptomyces alkaliterrae TaxID=2213162 RepID=A0A7W3ZL47_9ACTN|nr:hypothetical protein [Streptomyces alkaliterrae]MBB1252100.1 hypothetical protein [Streptomyces alkaliterrae]
MSDWTWDYLPDAENVVGGLDSARRAEVERIARSIADAVGVRRIGAPLTYEAASGVNTHAEGMVLIWYQEDYRDDVVLILRVQYTDA